MSNPSEQMQPPAAESGQAAVASSATPANTPGSGQGGSTASRDPLATPVIINVGLSDFAADLKRQNVAVQQVDWRPPAGGDIEIADLLSRLGV